MGHKELPHCYTGVDVLGRLAIHVTATWPGVPASLDSDQHYLGALCTFIGDDLLDTHSIVGTVSYLCTDEVLVAVVDLPPQIKRGRNAQKAPRLAVEGNNVIIGAVYEHH